MIAARPSVIALRRPGRRGVRLVALTPLIDIIFILLIFFMLQSSFIDWRALDLGLPGGEAAESADEPFVLAVGPQGGISHGGSKVAPARLEALLRGRAAAGEGGPVTVVPHPDAPLSALMPVLDAAEAAGAGPVAFARRAE